LIRKFYTLKLRDEHYPFLLFVWRATAMTTAPNLRKLMLIAHVTTSVGWLGAVASFLATDQKVVILGVARAV
jgi:hypothetical protein